MRILDQFFSQKDSLYCCYKCAKFSSTCKIIFIFSCILSSVLWDNFLWMTLYQIRIALADKDLSADIILGCLSTIVAIWHNLKLNSALRLFNGKQLIPLNERSCFRKDIVAWYSGFDRNTLRVRTILLGNASHKDSVFQEFGYWNLNMHSQQSLHYRPWNIEVSQNLPFLINFNASTGKHVGYI